MERRITLKKGNEIPEDLSSEERSYYRKMWGFDPVSEKKNSPHRQNASYYYEAIIPLESDQALQIAGVILHAIVDVDHCGKSHNNLVFTRGTQSRQIFCLYTVANPLSDSPSKHAVSAILPPWEHFIALKYFAYGIASMGIFNTLPCFTLLNERKGEFSSTDFIFELLSKIQDVLLAIVPEKLLPRINEYCKNLIESMPIKWFKEEWDWSIPLLGFYDTLGDTTFLESLKTNTKKKLLEILAEVHGEVLDDIVYKIYPSLLTDKVIKELDPPFQSELMDFLIQYRRFSGQNITLEPLLFRLFVQAMLRVDEELLQPDFLSHIIENLEDGGENGGKNFDFLKQVQPDFLNKLLQVIYTLWQKWHMGPGALFLYWFSHTLLRLEGNSQRNQKLLTEIQTRATHDWAQNFFPLLVKKFPFALKYLKRDYIDWTLDYSNWYDEDEDEVWDNIE